MIRSAAALTALCLLAVGCAHKPEAPRPPLVTFTFEPLPGTALIVLYRNVAGFMGGGAMVNSTLTVDNKPVGDLTQDRYAVIGVAPGEHMVNLQGVSGISNVPVSVGPGDVKFIQVTTYPSLIGTVTERETAMRDLDNEGQPLSLGLKYSFTGDAAPAAAQPGTTTL